MRVDKKIKEELKNYLIERLRNKQLPIILISAPYQLDENDVALLKKKFNFLEKSKIITEIDKNILSGFIMRFNSRIIDLTIDSELKTLENTLYETA